MLCVYQIFPVAPPAITIATNWAMRGKRRWVCAGTQTSSLTSVLRGDSKRGKTQSSIHSKLQKHMQTLISPAGSCKQHKEYNNNYEYLCFCPRSPHLPSVNSSLGVDVEELAEDCCAVRSQLEHLQRLLLQVRRSQGQKVRSLRIPIRRAVPSRHQQLS